MPITRNDFKGLTDQYLDTAGYTLDPTFQNIFLQDPKELDQRRIRAYKYFMDFYNDRHWEESGEVNPAYGTRDLTSEEFNRRTWNVSRNIVDKLVDFMIGQPWSIKLPEELEPEELTDVGQENPVHDVLESVWKANRREEFSYQMAMMGSVTGDVFVKIHYDEDFYAEGVGELKFTVLDSRTVIPFFDSLDRTKMIGCRIQYPVKEVQTDGSTQTRMYREIHTESTIVYLLDQEIQSVVPNPLGELLVVHIKNEPLPWSRFGRSDLEPLIKPNKELNEKVSELSEILNYHSAPITIVKGARLQQLEKGTRKIWTGIPPEGDVFNLNLDADLSSTTDYIDRLKTHLFETGNVPEETMGSVQAVSNTSGSALHIQYQPLVERTQRKQVTYGHGLMQINRIILRFYEAVGVLELPEDVPPAIKYMTSIQWGDALPRDRSIDLNDIATEIGLGIESKRGALKRLGEENPQAKLDEIKQETLEQAEMDFMSAGLGGFGDPAAGPDGMGGQPGMGGGPPGAAPGSNTGPQPNVQGAVNASKRNPATQGSQVTTQAVKRSAQETTGQSRSRGRPPGR